MTRIRVLQFSTHNEDCGIAKYQEQFVAEMIHEDTFYTEFFEYSPNVIKYLKKKDLAEVIGRLKSKLEGFDILHIQHEYSFFNTEELRQVIEAAKSLKKKVIVTVHTAPDAQYKKPIIRGLGPRSISLFVRQNYSAKKFKKKYLEPLPLADLIIVHNEVTKQSLVKFGVPETNIKIIKIPVPAVGKIDTSTEIKDALNKKSGDIIFGTVGFLSELKGTLHAIRALQYLPANYKLAIIGGIHPQGGNAAFLDDVADLVNDLGYKDRVYITGFVEDDTYLNSLIRECDICVYPIDTNYYQYVSSASLNNAIANHKPIVAYKTKPFEEVTREIPFIQFCKSPNYYELARSIKNIDIEKGQKLSKQYATAHSYPKEAAEFYKIYSSLI